MPFDPNDLSSIEPPKKKSSFNPDDLSIIGEKKKELSTPPAKPLSSGVATLSLTPTTSQSSESDNGQQISFYNPSSFLGGEKKPTQQETQQLQPRTSTFREQMLKERQMFGQKPSDISIIVPKNENAEQEVKFKEIAYEREKKAITNTAKYNLSKRGITKPAEDDLQDEEKSLRNKLHNNELGVTKDKFGEPALSRPREWYNVIGHTFTESVTHPFTSYDVNKKVISKDYKGLVEDYNKEQAEQPFIPESYNKGGAIDYLSEMVGGLPMMMGVPLAGTIATGTPFGGAAAYGALDAWNKLKDDLYKNYADLKKQYPDAPEEALMERASDIAKNEAPINFVTGTAIGLSGNVAKGGGILAGLETRGATQTAKQALKQNLKGIAKEIGFVSGTMGTGSAAKEGVEYAGGVDKKLSDVAQHSIDAMGDGALMTVIFKLAHEGVALPKATKGAIKEYLATQPEYLVDGMLSEMGKVGEGIQKKLTAYRELRKQFEGVVPDEQIGVFTQWQEKVNGIKDEIKTLEKKKGLVGVNVEKIDKRIAEKNKQIAEVQNKLNHYSKTGTITETDNDTGATITTTTNLESSPYTIEGKKVSEQDFINAMEDKSLANKQWHIDENGDKDITNRAVKEFKGKYDEPTTTTRPETKVEEETKITPTENIERVGASNEPITAEEGSVAETKPIEVVQPTEKPTPSKINVFGKEMNNYDNYIPTKAEDIESDALYSFSGNSKDEIPELLRDKATVNKAEINGVKSERWHASINGDDLLKLFNENKPTEQPKETIPNIEGLVDIRKESDETGDRLYFAEGKDGDIGKIRVSYIDGKVIVDDINVDKDFRRKGIATKLLNEIAKDYEVKPSEIEFGTTVSDEGEALRKSIQQPKTETSNVEDWSKDVESTAKALEDEANKNKGLQNEKVLLSIKRDIGEKVRVHKNTLGIKSNEELVEPTIIKENKSTYTLEYKGKEYDVDKGLVGFTDVDNLNNRISEQYHKAKEEGSNPELVKAVEDLLGKPKEQQKETIPNVEGNVKNSVIEGVKLDESNETNTKTILEKSKGTVFEKLANAIFPYLDKIKTLVSSNEKVKSEGKYGDGSMNDGLYEDGHIKLGNNTDLYHFYHEATHAVTVEKIKLYDLYNLRDAQRNKSALENGINLTEAEVKSIDELNRIYDKVKNNSNKFAKDWFYGLSNLKEFIAEAFTNKEFQNYLKNTKSEGKKTNLFNDFLNVISNILGIKDTGILNDIFAHTEELLGKPKEKEQANIGNQSIKQETNADKISSSKSIPMGEQAENGSTMGEGNAKEQTITKESGDKTNIKEQKEIGSIFDEALDEVYKVNENGEFKKANIMAENKFKSKYGEEGKKVIDIVKNFKKYAEQLGIEIKC